MILTNKSILLNYMKIIKQNMTNARHIKRCITLSLLKINKINVKHIK